MPIYSDTYGWAIEWRLPDEDLSGATSASFVLQNERTKQITKVLDARIEQDSGDWVLRHTVAKNAISAGGYHIRPLVEFGPGVRLSGCSQSLEVIHSPRS